jgi:prepilin-type N-terminal cleavage/methylation domain-containing protein
LSSERAAPGFTLIEALVALALILAFAALSAVDVPGPAVVGDADRRIAAHVLLRSLMDAPFDRRKGAQVSEGRSRAALAGHRRARLRAGPPAAPGDRLGPGPRNRDGVVGTGQDVSAETLRLARGQ